MADPSPQRRTRFVLFKQHVITAHDSHFAGGKHAFMSMASTLAAEGFDVHLISIASRGKVLVHAGMSGLLPLLSFARPGVVSWREGRLQQHVVLSDEGFANVAVAGLTPATLATLAACLRGLTGCEAVAAATSVKPTATTSPVASEEAPSARAAAAGGNSCPMLRCSRDAWVIIDADESQKLLLQPQPQRAGTAGREPTAAAAAAPSGSSASTTTTSSSASSCASTPHVPAITLFKVVTSAAPPRRCLALVQNVHFLPLGPSGSGPRNPSLLAAWGRLAGVVAVSEFVADYLRIHWPAQQQQQPRREQGQAQGGQVVTAAGGIGGGAADAPPPPCLPPVRVVPLATWGVYGTPPFPDLSEQARPLLRA
ncbi:hypothetical protein Agub_g4284, partial [Astrephomene gubernaculifera]